MQRFFRAFRDRKHDPPPLITGLCLALSLLVAGSSYTATVTERYTTTVQLTGRVIDNEHGNPVAGATVHLTDAGLSRVTDASGGFTFAALPPGEYAVEVSSVGYDPRADLSVRLTLDQPKPIVIRLTPAVYDLGAVRIDANRIRATSDAPVIIRREAIRQSQAGDIPDVLEQVDGLYVQKSGGSGPAEVRIRGSAAKQVLVLVDGQKINPAGTGVADLSTIPVEMVERIEVHTGGASARFGPDALGGAINIITRPDGDRHDRSIALGSDAGPRAYRKYTAQTANPIDIAGLDQRFSYSHQADNGDFDYDYSVADRSGDAEVYTGTRRNNDVTTSNWAGSGVAALADEIDLSYTFQRYRSRRGLPGSVSRPDTVGRANDNRLLGNVALTVGATAENSHETMVGFSSFDQELRNTDPATSPAYRFHGRFLNEILTLQHTSRRRLWPNNESRLQLEYRRDRLYHDDQLRPAYSMGQSNRSSRSAALSISQRFDLSRVRIVDMAALDGALRYDHASTTADYETLLDRGESHVTESWSPRIGLAMTKGDSYRYGLRASYGKSLRLPSINALFWRGDARSTGNPDLRPERSEHSEIALDLGADFSWLRLHASASYFHSKVTDLVVWYVNFQGQWEPRNVGAAQITGHEESVTAVMFDGLATLSYHNAVTDALNKAPGHATHNKRLVFYPRYMTRVRLHIDYAFLSASYEVRWADKTYTNEANTKWYDEHRIDDLSLTAEIPVAPSWTLTGSFAIDNVLDEDYVLLANYPMPGRTFGAGLHLTFSPDGDASGSAGLPN
ncbi:TonB-dependent receptor [candidate division GN15 bacterium]|nr:TonB-dependent receptor [candidate division GN15 bacterium]